jgi:hypothetical protein
MPMPHVAELVGKRGFIGWQFGEITWKVNDVRGK